MGRNMKIRAEVQYHDYEGTIAADGRVGEGLDRLAKKVGIDTEKYHPLYVTLYMGEGREIRPKDSKPCQVTVGCIPRAEIGPDETWEDYFKRSDGRPKIYVRHADMSLEDALDLHRLSIALYRRGLNVEREYEEIDLADSDN